jgi:hypothetical protein
MHCGAIYFNGQTAISKCECNWILVELKPRPHALYIQHLTVVVGNLVGAARPKIRRTNIKPLWLHDAHIGQKWPAITIGAEAH